MAGLIKREPKPVDVFERFDRLFDEWTRTLPFRWPAWSAPDWRDAEVIRVDEYAKDRELVIRAELPGIDPDEDVEVTVADGTLHITAERTEEKREEEKGNWIRREIRRGSFSRSLALPEGVSEDDISASYRDGILEITVPMPEKAPAAKRIEVAKA
ncbi:MAG TPA: Hsp20/alpha crystallin family protein [Acidimicrobiales bacterium]|nr:Hsp20/alpha crystallin family protein [Acidimicrobiales bacterium]